MTRILLALLLLPTAAFAEPLSSAVRLVSDVPEMVGKQVQLPLWAPGSSPRLVHEMTDRDKSTVLRLVTVTGPAFAEQFVPGAGSSRLESMGAGAARADTQAAWWDEGTLFFVRSIGGSSSLHYFDGVPREVAGLPGRVEEVVADVARGHLFVTMEDAGGLDVHRLSGKGFAEERRRLTRTQTEVEHSLAVEAGSGRLHFVSSGSQVTSLGQAGLDDLSASAGAGAAGLGAYELLSLAAAPSGDALVLYARVPAGAPIENSAYVLLELAGGKVTVLAPGVFLPPGLAPAPALSHDGRYVYYVLADSAGGNPVRRIDRTTRKSDALELPTNGHQEVAVSAYPDASGKMVPWVAVVAVGDEKGQDVRNHLYIGPLGPWPGW